MLASSLPSKIQLPFANSGTKNTIPVPSQISILAGAASFNDGFPPLTLTPRASGGVPPYGADFNGILYTITAIQQWQSAGGIFKYDSAFSTAISGYPAGAILLSSDGSTEWLNLSDGNPTNPDATDGSAANWVSLAAYGIGTVSGLTNTNVTLTPVQFSKRIIIATGTLTGNVQLIFPTYKSDWIFINNTTGAYTVTCKTAAGTGAIVSQGASALLYGDGTNIVDLGILTQSAADSRYFVTGEIRAITGSTLPSGWLWVPIASTNISRTTYAALFAAIGTTWGAGDGSTTFGLPYVGADGTLLQSNANLGSTTLGSVIAHTHSIPVGTNSAPFSTTTGTAIGSTTSTTGSTGGSQNTAAGSRVNFIIKY